MPYPIEKKLVIAVASSALFDLTESDSVFRQQGEAKYREYQERNIDKPFKKGVAFPFIKRLLALNASFPELKPVEVILISRNSPETAMYLIEMLSKELQDANEKAFLFSIRHPEERIAAFLLFRDARCIGSTIDMKLDDIAASIGLRRETISRYLSRMEKNHLIRREGNGRLRVINRDELKNLYTL